MMHWKSHSQVFTRLDDAGERRWATAANPTQGRRNVGNFGGPIIKKTAFDQFFLVRAKEPDQPNPNLTRTLHAGGQLDSILDPEDPTRLEIGFKLDSFGFILKVHFYVEPNFESFFRSIQSNSTWLNPKIGSGLATLFFLSFASERGKLMRDKKIRRANRPPSVPTPLRLR